MPIGLYMHIPFCVRKCAYCDFASFPNCQSDFVPVVSAMKAEMERAKGLSIDTVFIGGGTPTVLPYPLLVSLLDSAKQCFSIDKSAEITVEANPGTLTPQVLDALLEAGVNRLSIGAQAMQPHLLEAIGRVHSAADTENSVRMARAVGFSNINLDIMYGLPDQTPAMFRETLQWVFSLLPEHLSAYSLILEEGTPFHMRYVNHPEALPSEDETVEMSDDALWMAEDAGFRRYEISNYAKPSYECKHNLIYWRRQDYIGIGCAAHSLLKNHRIANARTIDGYLAGQREEESISEEEARFERLMMGLRLVEGIPWEEQALFDQFKEPLKRLRATGLIDYDNASVWPTNRGLDLQNRILMELMK